ncbi:MAG: orotate phosphoribosyltransferase [Deltaproteobacteria bacterium]|nr:orotate phosphoribosyltransferase [Deltaproteobacteria bacterium]
MVQDRYIEWLLRSGALRFGEFKTKSGRLSPYFFNTGCFDSGQSLGGITELYAEVIAERFGSKVENLFGPAYKGIPLAVMTSYHLSRNLGRDISYTFNRKEAKDHGEGGTLVGRLYCGGERVVLVEDVVTGGTSFREMRPILESSKVEVVGIVVGVDRQERGTDERAALLQVAEDWRVPTASLVTVSEVVSRLHNREILGRVWIDDVIKARIDDYLATYGGRLK